jgi:antitoxin MazE
LIDGCVRNRLDATARSNYIVIMRATLVRIGNSRGIRLPKPVIEQCGFEDQVEMEVHHHKLVIRSPSLPRKDWADAFAQMNECGDDELLDHVAESGPTWDEEEWEW